MTHMDEVGIRALKQNASEVVASVADGRTITITRRGRPVATLIPAASDRLTTLIDAGLARPAKTSHTDLDPPEPMGDTKSSLSADLLASRSDERY